MHRYSLGLLFCSLVAGTLVGCDTTDMAAPTGANNPAENTGLQGGGPTPSSTGGTNDPANTEPGTNSIGE